jgi:hypothetical protein
LFNDFFSIEDKTFCLNVSFPVRMICDREGKKVSVGDTSDPSGGKGSCKRTVVFVKQAFSKYLQGLCRSHPLGAIPKYLGKIHGINDLLG